MNLDDEPTELDLNPWHLETEEKQIQPSPITSHSASPKTF